MNENCKNRDFCGFFDFEVAQKRPYQRVFEFFLRDDVECSQISALVKKQTKNLMKFWSKNSVEVSDFRVAKEENFFEKNLDT